MKVFTLMHNPFTLLRQTLNFKLMFYPFKRAMISWICFFIS